MPGPSELVGLRPQTQLGGLAPLDPRASMLMLLLAPKANAIRCPPPPKPSQPASCSPHPKVHQNCSLLPLPLAPFCSKAAGRYPLPAAPKPFSAPRSPPLRRTGCTGFKKTLPYWYHILVVKAVFTLSLREANRTICLPFGKAASSAQWDAPASARFPRNKSCPTSCTPRPPR